MLLNLGLISVFFLWWDWDYGFGRKILQRWSALLITSNKERYMIRHYHMTYHKTHYFTGDNLDHLLRLCLPHFSTEHFLFHPFSWVTEYHPHTRGGELSSTSGGINGELSLYFIWNSFVRSTCPLFPFYNSVPYLY